MALLPMDGTDYLRLPIGTFRVSFNDLFLTLVLYFDFLDGMAMGFRFSKFLWRIGSVVFLITMLSAVSLLYVPSVGFAYDVKMTLNFLEFLVLLYLTTRIVLDVETLRRALMALVFGASLVAAGTWAKSLGFDVPGQERSGGVVFFLGPFLVGVTGIVGSGLSFDMALLGAFPAVLVRRIFPSNFVRWPLLVLLGFAGFIVYSRGLWLSLLVELMVVLALGMMIEDRPFRKRIAAAGWVVATGALLFFGPSLYHSLIELRPVTVTYRLAGYLYAWKLSTQGLVEFLFGAGKGFFAATFVYTGVPHNFFIDLLVSKGILAVLVFLSLLTAIGWMLFFLVLGKTPGASPEARWLALVLLTSLLGTVTEGLFAPITTSMNFLAVVSLSTALLSIVRTEPVIRTAPSVPLHEPA